MVGRVSQVSFSCRKLLVFSKNDSPLARGRLQNAKIKELRIISELPELSQKTAKMARCFLRF